MNIKLRIWRQTAAHETGLYESHELQDVSSDLSLLEVLDNDN